MKRLLFGLSIAAVLWMPPAAEWHRQSAAPCRQIQRRESECQYAFATNGESFSGGVNSTPLARVGRFHCGRNGQNSKRGRDVNAPGTTSLALPITGGSYTVNADGRGTLTLQLAQTSIDFGITLTSTNDGLMIDESSNANQSSTGSGTSLNKTRDPSRFRNFWPHVSIFQGWTGTKHSVSLPGVLSAIDPSNGRFLRLFR